MITIQTLQNADYTSRPLRSILKEGNSMKRSAFNQKVRIMIDINSVQPKNGARNLSIYKRMMNLKCQFLNQFTLEKV
jgi:hypothetical protein